MKILLVMPSRRLANAFIAIDSAINTSSGLCDIVLCVDDDDESPIPEFDSHVKIVRGKRKSFAKWVNEVVVENINGYDVFGWSADDLRFRTKNWDLKVASQITPGGMVYGRDGLHDKSLMTHPLVDRIIPASLGYLIHPSLNHYYADNWLQLIGQKLGRVVYDDSLFIEHMHPAAHKAPNDDLYQHNMSTYFKLDEEAWRKIYNGPRNDNSTVYVDAIKKKLRESCANKQAHH